VSSEPGSTPEDELLEFIRGALSDGISGVDDAFGLRDDAAVVALPGGGGAGSLVVSVDSVVQGIHFDFDLCTPGDAGWKALMRSLSDLAAMGSAPLGALVALCVPGSTGSGELAKGLMGGVAEASRSSGCPVVGGDVSGAGEGQVVISVTVLGTVDGAVSRSGARPGDALYVTGPCGGSAAGLRELRSGAPGADARRAYRRPVARLAAGEAARRARAHALIDVSDGLALDLHRLADASRVGFVLDDVPVAAGATFEEALGGGEDYELVLAVADDGEEDLVAGFERAGLPAPVRLGSAHADPELRVLGGSALERLGWQHTVG
jgi:thiamine-monophosphate kinase